MFQHTFKVWDIICKIPVIQDNSYHVQPSAVNNLYSANCFALVEIPLPPSAWIISKRLIYFCRLSCLQYPDVIWSIGIWSGHDIKKFRACLLIISHRTTGISRKYKHILCSIGWWWWTSCIKWCTTCRAETAGTKVFITGQGLAPT